MSETKNYTREEYVYLAKLYERAERFPDMVKAINKYVELGLHLYLHIKRRWTSPLHFYFLPNSLLMVFAVDSVTFHLLLLYISTNLLCRTLFSSESLLISSSFVFTSLRYFFV